MQDLQIGVVGLGARGGLADLAHKPGEGSRVVAVCDRNPATWEKAREKYGADLFVCAEFSQLLGRDLDAVFITSPDFLHEEHAVAALEAKIAVYLEKPMAISTAGCDRILKAACQTKTRLYVGHNMRHMPFVLEMKRLIDAGEIGEVKAVWCRHFVGNGGDFYFKDWHAERRYSTSLLLQKAAHDLDIIHWLAGSYSARVNALGGLMVYGQNPSRLEETDGPRSLPPFVPGQERAWPPAAHTGLNTEIDVEDLSMMQMQLQNGAFAAYQQCHFTPDYWRNYTVIGDEGRIENFGNGSADTVIRLWNKRAYYNAEGDATFPVEVPEGGHGGSDPRIIAEFLRYVRDGGRTQTSPIAARYSVAAGCAATESLRDGGTLRDVVPVAPEIEACFA